MSKHMHWTIAGWGTIAGLAAWASLASPAFARTDDPVFKLEVERYAADKTAYDALGKQVDAALAARAPAATPDRTAPKAESDSTLSVQLVRLSTLRARGLTEALFLAGPGKTGTFADMALWIDDQLQKNEQRRQEFGTALADFQQRFAARTDETTLPARNLALLQASGTILGTAEALTLVAHDLLAQQPEDANAQTREHNARTALQQIVATIEPFTRKLTPAAPKP